MCFVVDTTDGRFVDAGLSEETKEYLRRFAANEAGGSVQAKTVERNGQNFTELESPLNSETGRQDPVEALVKDAPNGNMGQEQSPLKLVEVPLTSDSEFFDLLKGGLSGLDNLQEHEQAQLTKEVQEIGTTVSRMVAPSKSSQSTDIARWRHIFELYVGAEVFFSTNEHDHGSRNATNAAKQLEWFSTELVKNDLGAKFNRKESLAAFNRFMQLNVHLLQHLKFQEVNQTAMFKILKSMTTREKISRRTDYQ